MLLPSDSPGKPYRAALSLLMCSSSNCVPVDRRPKQREKGIPQGKPQKLRKNLFSCLRLLKGPPPQAISGLYPAAACFPENQTVFP